MIAKAGQIIAIDSVKVDNTLSGDGVRTPLGVKATAPAVSGHAGLSAEKVDNTVYIGMEPDAVKVVSTNESVSIEKTVKSDGTVEYNLGVSVEPVVSDTKIIGTNGISARETAPATYTIGVSGNYVKSETLQDYYTKDDANDTFQPKGKYVTSADASLNDKQLVLKNNKWEEVDAGTDYTAGDNIDITNDVISGRDWTPELAQKADTSALVGLATETWVEETLNDVIDDYYTSDEVDNLLDNYALSADVDTAIAENEESIKAWANDEFQEKGDYAENSDIDSLSSTVNANFQKKGKYVTSADNSLEGKALVLKNNKWEEAPEGTTYTEGPNIDIVGTVISGRNWTPELDLKADKTELNTLATKTELNNLNAAVAGEFVSTSAWANKTFQPKGNYLTNDALLDYYNKSEVDDKVEELANEFDSVIDSVSATVDRDFATKTELKEKLDKSETTNWDVKEYSAGENITIQNHKISGKDWSTEIDAKQDKLTDKQLSAISSVSAIQAISGDWATKTEVDTLVDNSIADISATVSTDYLKKADVKEYSAGNNIDITNYVISGRDWSPELNTKVNNSDFTIYSADIDSQLVTLSANKLDKSYSATVNSLLDDKLDKTDFDTYSATVDNQIAAKLNTSDFDEYKSSVSAEFSATSAWALDTFFPISDYFSAVSGTNSSSEYFKWTGDTLSASWMVKHFNLSFNYAVKPVSVSPDFIYSSRMQVGNTTIDDRHYIDGYSDTVNYNVSFNIYNADDKTYKFTFSADDKLNLENLHISCIGFINPRTLSGNLGFVEDGTSGNFVDSQGNNLIFVEKLPVG